MIKTISKNNNLIVAKETQEIVQQGFYLYNNKPVLINKLVDKCVNDTRFYPADEKILHSAGEYAITVEITNETTGNAINRLLTVNKAHNVVALNFASAHRPGGGWLNGAAAQEEALARCSALVKSLESKPEFYESNKEFNSPYYTDAIIYSPDVPFFRDEQGDKIAEPFFASIITSPAPNASNLSDKMWLQPVIEQRIVKILRTAAAHHHRTLVLGAWGCGVFGNDPAMVARAFIKGLCIVRNFDHVCFAVYDERFGTPLLNAFKRVFDEEIV